MNFKANEHENEYDYLFAMENLIARKEEKKVTNKEWDSVWMMVETKKRDRKLSIARVKKGS